MASPAQQAFYTSVAPQGPTTAERMAAYELHAPRLAVAARGKAFTDADVEPAQVTHLVTVSCSGFSAPGVDLALFRKPWPVGRNRANSRRVHGLPRRLNGLRIAQAFARGDAESCTLVCAVELCSLHHQYDWQPEQIVANALFGDGAASIVVRAAAPLRFLGKSSTSARRSSRGPTT